MKIEVDGIYEVRAPRVWLADLALFSYSTALPSLQLLYGSKRCGDVRAYRISIADMCNMYGQRSVQFDNAYAGRPYPCPCFVGQGNNTTIFATVGKLSSYYT